MSDQPGPSEKFKFVHKVNLLDPDFEKTCLKWYEECNSDLSDEDDVDEEAHEAWHRKKNMLHMSSQNQNKIIPSLFYVPQCYMSRVQCKIVRKM